MLDTNADEIDGSDMAGSVSDAISDFITPDVGIAKGKVVKSSTGASAIAATLAGVGALSAGAVAVSYTHLTLPTMDRQCRSRWSPYH